MYFKTHLLFIDPPALLVHAMCMTLPDIHSGCAAGALGYRCKSSSNDSVLNLSGAQSMVAIWKSFPDTNLSAKLNVQASLILKLMGKMNYIYFVLEQVLSHQNSSLSA